MSPSDLDPVTLAVIQNGLQAGLQRDGTWPSCARRQPRDLRALDRSDGIYGRDDGRLIAAGRARAAGVRRYDAVLDAGR